MKIYLDNCCFNRPFDDQSSMRVKLEAEAKLFIQEKIITGKLQLVWSHILEYENRQNPFVERRNAIIEWKQIATKKIFGGSLMITDTEIKQKGIKALIAELGNVQAERFISLIIREPFDYTKWQRDLWPDESVESLSKKAMEAVRGKNGEQSA